MRPVVKIEGGEVEGRGAEGLQEEAGAGRAVQRRRVGEAGDAAWDEVQMLRLNMEAQAQAIQGMELTRVLEARVAALAAEVKIEDEALQSKDALLHSKDMLLQTITKSKDEALQSKDVIIQSKDALLQAKDRDNCLLQQKVARQGRRAARVR